MLVQAASLHHISLVDAEAVQTPAGVHPAVSYWFNGLKTVEIPAPFDLLTVTENVK